MFGSEASEYGEPVADREDGGLDSGIAGDEVVESGDGACLCIGRHRSECHLAVPKRIVSEYVSTLADEWHDHFEIVGIEAFVGVDEYHVPRLRRDLRHDFERVAYMKRDAKEKK